VAPSRSPLAGLVEVDQTEIACHSKYDPMTGSGGRSRQAKLLVVGEIEVEDGDAGPGRVRLTEVPEYSANSLHLFIAHNLAMGATAKTDGRSVPGVTHDRHVIGQDGGHVVLPWANRIFSNLKVCAPRCLSRSEPGISNPTSMNSFSALTAAIVDTLFSALCSASPPRSAHLQYIDSTGSKATSCKKARHLVTTPGACPDKLPLW
jgi:ISXO2-like transposase domain